MYDEKVLQAFLDQQLKLFPRKVAENEKEALDFLEDSCAEVFFSIDDVWEYLDEEMDISDIEKSDISEIEEVFEIGDGRYLVVEG